MALTKFCAVAMRQDTKDRANEEKVWERVEKGHREVSIKGNGSQHAPVAVCELPPSDTQQSPFTHTHTHTHLLHPSGRVLSSN